MATRRHDIRIDCPPAAAWKVIRDAGSISQWFPLIESSSALGGKRSLTLANGARVEEDIVTSDDALRRFQYRICGGDIPVGHHLGTIDVHDVDGKTLVVYATEVSPDELADVIGPATADALAELRRQLER